MLKEHGLLFFDKPLQLKNIKYENRPFEGTVSHSVVLHWSIQDKVQLEKS